MTITPEPPWLCVACGYLSNSVAPADPNAPATPSDGDNTICLNCGWTYVRHGTRWLPMTAAERASLTPDERRDLEHAEAARVAANLPDLTRRRGGRA
jgi:hypothetical protein